MRSGFLSRQYAKRLRELHDRLHIAQEAREFHIELFVFTQDESVRFFNGGGSQAIVSGVGGMLVFQVRARSFIETLGERVEIIVDPMFDEKLALGATAFASAPAMLVLPLAFRMFASASFALVFFI